MLVAFLTPTSPSVKASLRSILITTISLTALAATADEPTRPFRAALVPQLSVGAAAERLPRGWIGLGVARLSWPLDALHHDPALIASQRRASLHRQRIAGQMSELYRRRAALLSTARDAERELDLEETQAELDALEERP